MTALIITLPSRENRTLPAESVGNVVETFRNEEVRGFLKSFSHASCLIYADPAFENLTRAMVTARHPNK